VIALLQLLWPVMGLLHLPAMLNTIAVVVFKRIAHTHDWEHADDLPQTAGDWLRDRAAVFGLRVIVTDQPGQSDAYHPDRRVIHLSPQTHFKSDAVFWAIAAHELGHARIYGDHPLLGALSRVSMWMKPLFMYVGTGLAIGNVLYARPRGLDLAFAFLAGSLVLRMLEAIEEAYASYLAHGELRASAHLTPIHLRVVRRTLLAALGTYVATAAGGAILLSQWSIVERIAGDGWLGELGALTTLGWVVVITLCVLGLAYAFVHQANVRLRSRQRSHQLIREAEGTLGLIWRVLLLILIVLVWDLSGTGTWAWCVILAIIATQRLVVGLLMLPGFIPLMVFATLIRKLSGPGHHASDEFAASQAAGKPLILDGNHALKEILETRRRNPTPQSRVFELMLLLYLPLIVAIGGGLIT
jgi:Zn-dependent membrane protease YugP